MASSFQSSTQSSTSEPFAIRTPENDIINQLSSVAAGLAQQMNQWAQGVFAQTSQITNQTVGNFFQVSQKMMGLSNELTDQYNNVFAPQNRSLAAEANSFNSDARQRVEMGKAGATQAQAGDAALKGAEESLRSFGIDPSSGRYAALDKAAAVQNAANVAGAQNMARDRTAQTGRELRSQAVQVGAQLPAAIANVNNTAIQANTGASNASLANANTGANLQRLANEYLKTAMDVKLPPIGNRQNSQGQSNGQSSSPDSGGGGRMPSGGGGGSGGGNPGYGGGGGGGPAWMPAHGNAQAGPPVGRADQWRQPNAAITQTGANWQDSANAMAWRDQAGGYDPWGSVTGDEFQQNDYYQPGGSMNIDYSHGNEDVWNGGHYQDNPFNDSGFGQTYDYGGPDQTYTGSSGASDTQWGNINYDTAANNAYTGWDNYYDQPQADTDWGGGGGNTGFNDYGFGGGGGGSTYDTTSPNSDWYAGDYGQEEGFAYADGGAIPSSMSPSGGQMVDDIPAQLPGGGEARLNADEFVIPRDVALWKGQEFFQKLIEQSRMRNATAPAKPQQQPMR